MNSHWFQPERGERIGARTILLLTMSQRVMRRADGVVARRCLVGVSAGVEAAPQLVALRSGTATLTLSNAAATWSCTVGSGDRLGQMGMILARYVCDSALRFRPSRR